MYFVFADCQRFQGVVVLFTPSSRSLGPMPGPEGIRQLMHCENTFGVKTLSLPIVETGEKAQLILRCSLLLA
jgi:hypothetical protein